MELGERILRLRGEKNLSQEALADALGVSRQSVSKWENGVSVPELDKLVQMGELFGVSLDELIKGEAAKSPEAPEAARAVPDGGSRTGGGTRRITGVLLLCFGALTALLLFCLGGGLFSLLCASPFLACGIICLTLRRRLGLWCAWAVWLCVELYLRWATGLDWRPILLTHLWTPEMNYVRLVIAWIMALVPVLLIFCTVRSFRDARAPFGGKPPACLGAWAAVLAVWLLRGAAERLLWSLQSTSGPISYELREALFFWSHVPGDWLIAALLCAALIWTLAFLKQRQKRGAPAGAARTYITASAGGARRTSGGAGR